MHPLRHLTRVVAQQLGEGPGPERRARQRIAVARLSRSRSERGSGRWRWWLPVVAAGLLLWAWIGVEPAEPPAIARVGGQSVMAGAWLAAPVNEPLAVVFGDRSRVSLAAGSAARLAHADASRVQIDLERGQVEVAATRGAAWLVVAGPFAVDVTDSEVRVEWEPQTQALAVAVQRGEVRVRGGSQVGEGTRLGAGQRLAIGGVVASVAAPAVEVGGCVGECSRPRTRAQGRGPESWAALAEAGEHAAALAEAERQGFAALLERLDAEQLDRLAHSARLAGAGSRAREVLQTLRRRFPRSSRAGTAAFVLGRIAVDLEGDPKAAIEWFGRYLAEQPAGPLAEEARGRLLRALHDEGDEPRARAAAEDYLRHHPDGSHAKLARTIVTP